jgi:FSR family fosmidomycin resistance protein-like MFS transporter
MPVLPAILPLLIAHEGYSYLAAGLLITAYNVTSSFTQPVLGWLSDSRGFSVSISISLMISAVFIALIGIAHDYTLIMVLAVLAALGHACFHPAALGLVSRLCSAENRGRLTSYFVVGGDIGYAIGPILAGALVLWLGLPGLLFLVFPAIFMICALRYRLPGGIAGASAAYAGSPRSNTEEKHRSKIPFLILLTSSIFRAWAIFAAITFLPTYLVSRGCNLMEASTLVSLMLLAGVAGQIAGGQVSDRIGRKEYMILGLIGAVPSFFVFYTTTGIVSFAAMLVFGFSLWSTFAVAVAMSHELLPENVGLASGVMMGLAIGIGGLGVAITGVIADQYSLAAALWSIPLLLFAAMLFMVVLPYPYKTWGRDRALSVTGK